MPTLDREVAGMSQDTARSSTQEGSDRRVWVFSRVTLTVVVNVVFLIWLIAGAFMRSMRGCGSLFGSDKALCESANGGTSAGTVILWWLLVDAIFLVVWLVKRRRARLAAPSAE